MRQSRPMMRRTACLTTTVCLLAGVALAACGEASATPPSPPPAATETVPTATVTVRTTPSPKAAFTTSATAIATSTAAAVATPTATPTPTVTLSTAAERAAYERLSSLVPWFSGRQTRLTVEAAEIVIQLWLEDAELAEAVVETDWFQDGITSRDLETMERFGDLAARDAAAARLVATTPWFEGSVDDRERRLIELLGASESSPEFVAEVPEYGGRLTEHLLAFLVRSHHFLLDGSEPEPEWFADGLSPLEMAFAVALKGLSYRSPQLREDLLRERYVATRSVSLPLAGEVSVYLFQNTPIADAPDILDRIEATARALEQLLDVPFPTTEVILLIGDATAVTYRVPGGGHLWTHMNLARRTAGVLLGVEHETAHYLFRTSSDWFTEGGAEFIARYVEGTADVSLYTPGEDRPPSHAETCLAHKGARNIRHHTLLRDEIPGPSPIGRVGFITCDYSLGEWLLVHLYDRIGEEALGEALRSWFAEAEMYGPDTLYLTTFVSTGDEWHGPTTPADQLIYEAMVRGLPEHARAGFEEVLREKHGGIGGGPDDGIPDDVGDGVESSSTIAPGQTVRAELEHDFDFDYFRFTATAGEKYEIDFQHGTPTSSLALYDIPASLVYHGHVFYEHHGEALRRITPATSHLPRYRLWVAPRSGDFYLAAQNFGGAPGPYRLTVTALEDVLDDHGDSLASATSVALGEEVGGRIDDERDFDFFFFQADERQLYRVEVSSSDGRSFVVWLFDGKGRDPYLGISPGVEPRSGAVSLRWETKFPGQHYVAVSGAGGASYTVVITDEGR